MSLRNLSLTFAQKVSYVYTNDRHVTFSLSDDRASKLVENQTFMECDITLDFKAFAVREDRDHAYITTDEKEALDFCSRQKFHDLHALLDDYVETWVQLSAEILSQVEDADDYEVMCEQETYSWDGKRVKKEYRDGKDLRIFFNLMSAHLEVATIRLYGSYGKHDVVLTGEEFALLQKFFTVEESSGVDSIGAFTASLASNTFRWYPVSL